MRARALKWVWSQQCWPASLGGRRPGAEGVGEGLGVPRNPAETEAHGVGGSAGGEAWRQGESDAAQPAAVVGRDRARSHLARGGGRCQRGPGGLGPGAVRVLLSQGSYDAVRGTLQARSGVKPGGQRMRLFHAMAGELVVAGPRGFLGG